MKPGFVFSLLLFSVAAFSQRIYIARVCDNDTKLPLQNVAIAVDTSRAYSNAKGFFQLRADTSQILEAQLSGYEKASLKIPLDDRFVFYLKRIQSDEDKKLIMSFYKHFGERIKYPADARRRGVQGKAIVYFEVDSLGKVLVVDIINEVGAGCTTEVIRVLKTAPEIWYEVKKHKKFILPVTFEIGGTNSANPSVGKQIPQSAIRLEEIVIKAYSSIERY